MSTVIVKNIYAEDLFQWFYTHVMESCGDGASTIVCSNYEEVADWFTEWWRGGELPQLLTEKYREFCMLQGFIHPKEYISKSGR